ncbi:MAG: hypothetical protein M3364_01935 [Actinomycetota bacterium]|nr:hypothetical protein [Actinomycetota bacterium]
MRLGQLLAVLTCVLGVAAYLGESSSATASATSACVSDADGNGYTYAGHQATFAGHGVRATITPTRALNVAAGHVAGWVGVGGPGQGANGEDAWLQVGIASVEGTAPYLYAEVTRNGRQPQLMLLDENLRIGVSRRVAVLETSAQSGAWRVWVDGRPVTKSIHLRGSSGRWAPIATAESFNRGEAGCNTFAFRFERVSISYGGGGSWRPFVSGHRFLDPGHKLQSLAEAPAVGGTYSSEPSGRSPLPYAFVASS